ncbi:SDR family oxidoreductase [Vibrio tapetis subsp. quintayensis]|uniref:UDP-glucose 4-epimerase family protein n=1 Tax=Vibrio tapetis TaxID=52443 RepID=UPI0025B52D9C|nr:SDR family oxidoreductase [Vibrio tapetis]MDN3679434.1 SDR family oxidoreductase [Vibrio tapetis subsp. quintayensis]
MKVLLTGGSGFVGQQILKLLKNQHDITCFGRQVPECWQGAFIKGELEKIETTPFDLSGFDAVVHSAARAHIMQDTSNNPLDEYRKINTTSTVALAKRAAEHGVKRFVFISSIKVNGESTINTAFSACDQPNPSDDYGVSKAEAESLLLALAEETGMEVVIIRPPLIYGPGVKANFASLFKIAGKGLPLPLGCIDKNLRSMVSIYNFIDFINVCLMVPQAANQVFLVSDGEDISIRHLVERLANLQGKAPWMIPVPLRLFQLVGKLTGKTAVIDRLAGSLQVDIQKNQRMLNWKPPYTMQQSLQRMMDELKYN